MVGVCGAETGGERPPRTGGDLGGGRARLVVYNHLDRRDDCLGTTTRPLPEPISLFGGGCAKRRRFERLLVSPCASWCVERSKSIVGPAGQLGTMQKASEMVQGRIEMDGEKDKRKSEGSNGDCDVEGGQGRVAGERQREVVVSGGVGGKSGREWWELKGMKKKWGGERKRKKISEVEKKRGVTMVVHAMLREKMEGGYEEKFVETMDAMVDVRLLLGGERGIFGEGRHKRDLYKRHQLRKEGGGDGGFPGKSKWGVAQAKRIWGLVEDPISDGGVARDRVQAANEVIGMIHKDTRKRDRYASAATALNGSSMDINRVLNWLMGMQRWDVLQQVEKSTALLGASVVLCGECSTPKTESAASERVVSVQRSIQDMRTRFGCLRLSRTYVVHKGGLLVVVVIGPVAELAELQNCVVPFMLMLNPRATIAAKAPVSHLIARELFYSAAHSRRLVWAMANAALLLGHSTGDVQSHKAMAAALSSVLVQEHAQGAEWLQHAHDVTRARCAVIEIAQASGSHDVQMARTVLALCRGHMGCLADNETVRQLGLVVSRAGAGAGGCAQSTSRLRELCDRTVFRGASGSTRVGMAAAGLICGAIGMTPLLSGLEKASILESTARVLRPTVGEKTTRKLPAKHLRLLSHARVLESWTVAFQKPVQRQFTGLSEARGNKPQMALIRKAQRMAKAIQSRRRGYTIVNRNGTTGLQGEPPINVLAQEHPAFDVRALQHLVIFFRKAESRAVCEGGDEMLLEGEDLATCTEMHRFEYPCTVGTDGTARMLSDVFPATRSGTPMDDLPYPAAIIGAVYDPLPGVKASTRLLKPQAPPRAPPLPPWNGDSPKQMSRGCTYFSQMWVGIDQRPAN